MSRWWCAWICCLALTPTLAAAHSFDPAVLALHESSDGGGFDLIWRAPGPGSGWAADALRPQLPASCGRAAVEAALAAGYGRIDCGGARLHGERIAVHGLDGTPMDAIVQITWSDGAAATAALRSGSAAFTVPGSAGGASAWLVLWSYLRLGIAHILGGLDHLLFVLGLLLLVESRRRLLQTITAFTLAHSLSLGCATAGLVHVAPALVEPLIALSIVLVAVELVRDGTDGSLTRRWPWAAAFTFGLLHGLGFAGALAEVGLPPGQFALGLLAFNSGVEIGQLAFVCIISLPLALLARWPRLEARLQFATAYGIGVLASAWTIERVLLFWT